jgi:hypothetical protein
VSTYSDLTRRSLAGTISGALAIAATSLGTSPLPATATELSDLVCPAPGASSSDSFSDDDGSPHEANIDCAAQYGLVK